MSNFAASHFLSPAALCPAESRPRAARPVALLSAIVIAAYVFVVSAGHIRHWPQYSAYFDLQADAYVHGQLSLLTQPDPRLLGLADPYDPAQNHGLRLHDASLFRGKYYLYWGPTPALALVPFKLAGVTVGDQDLTFAFVCAMFLAGAGILVWLWKRHFADQPVWILMMSIAVLGLGTPMPFLLARAAVYEAAVSAGAAFLLTGLLIALRGMDRPQMSVVSMLGTSICWMLAIGARTSLLPAVAVMVLILMTRAWPSYRSLLALTLPLLLGGIALAAYNTARFGSPFEFGQRYQLAGHELIKLRGGLFSLANVPPGVWSYLCRPLVPLSHFPFVHARGGDGTFPGMIHLPPGYETEEPIAGIAIATPFLWFACVPLLRLIRRRKVNAESSADPRPAVILVASAGLIGFAPVLFMVGSTMRYLLELTPALSILATIGVWQVMAARPDGADCGRRFGAVAMAIITVGVGLLLGMSGYYDHFAHYNPALFHVLGGQ